MKLFYALFFILVFLLSVILCAGLVPEVVGATGVPHPEFKGMMVSPANIDQQSSTRYLGYLFGLGVISLLSVMLFIGNRKNGKNTSLVKPLSLGLTIYILVFSLMVFSHWKYSDNGGGDFFLSMPSPTAWMILGVWFVPLVITISYITKFEEAIISDKEIEEFNAYIKDLNNNGSI